MIDSNQTFTKIMPMDWQQISWPWNVAQGHISRIVISSYYQTDLNQIFFSNYDAATGVVAAGPHFLTLDNSLLYVHAPPPPKAFICR